MATTDIQYKTTKQLVQLQLDYITANLPSALTAPLGPFITAFAYAVALVGLVLQRLIQLVLKAARLSTATGNDIDSFIGDFDLTRFAGVAASGVVRLSRNVANASTLTINLNGIVQTSSTPPVQFSIVADTSNSAFDSSLNAYQMAGGNSFVDVKVQCAQVGIIGNVALNTINKIGSSMPGIDSVANNAQFINGEDIETDDAVRLRFALFIQSLSKATQTAVASAAASVQQGLIIKIFENKNTDNTTNNGQFVLVLDDGTGVETTSIKSAVADRVETARPIGVRPLIVWAQPKNTIVGAHIQYDPLKTPDVLKLKSTLVSSILAFINNLTPGDTAHYARLYKAIWGSISPGDEVLTSIAATPSSTVTQLFVGSTTGMAVGQMVQVAGVTTGSGAFPKIISVDSDTSITIDTPFTSEPVASSDVSTFSTRGDQIIDIETLLFSPVAATTTIASSPASSSTVLKVTSGSGTATSQFVIVDGYQTQTGVIPQISSGATTTSITISPGIGTIDQFGTWTAGGPPSGTSVVFSSQTAITAADITTSGSNLRETIRSSSVRIYLGMATT